MFSLLNDQLETQKTKELGWSSSIYETLLTCLRSLNGVKCLESSILVNFEPRTRGAAIESTFCSTSLALVESFHGIFLKCANARSLILGQSYIIAFKWNWMMDLHLQE